MPLQEMVANVIAVPPGYFQPTDPHPRMANGQRTVGSTVVQILPVNYRRMSASVKNAGAGVVWIGAENDVSAATGHSLGPGEVINIVTPSALFGVSDSGTNVCTFLEEMVR